MGNELVWSRVFERKRRCKEGCEERKSWGLKCSEHVGTDGMAGGRFPQEEKGQVAHGGEQFLNAEPGLPGVVPGAVTCCLAVPSQVRGKSVTLLLLGRQC